MATERQHETDLSERLFLAADEFLDLLGAADPDEVQTALIRQDFARLSEVLALTPQELAKRLSELTEASTAFLERREVLQNHRPAAGLDCHELSASRD